MEKPRKATKEIETTGDLVTNHVNVVRPFLLKKTFMVSLSERKQADKRGDPKNGIAVYAHASHHTIDWDGATVKRAVTS